MATHNPLGAVATAAAREFNLACANFGICELAVVPDPARVGSWLSGLPEVRDGALLPSDRPGLGLTLYRGAAARAAVPPVHDLPLLRRADGSFTNW
jgi:L-alanine-DL-glutamate epimerase-like enolase superfamily enzyme